MEPVDTSPLEVNDQRLRQAIRVGNIGIFEHDHEVDSIYWSLELRQMYGFDADEPITLPKILSHVYPEDAARVGAAVRRAHDPDGDGLFDIEHRIIDLRGAIRWVLTRSQTHFCPANGHRRPGRTIGAVQDVTERRVTEQRLRVLDAQLVRAQKMEWIGRLAGGLAHDFNNLLMIIGGGVEVALGALPFDHATRGHLADAADAARSAALLTRQLLAFSRKEQITPRRLDLNEVLRRMERMLRRLLGDKIQLTTRLSGELPAICFDLGQLEQIILNLAINARDAMTDGGRLNIETSQLPPDDAGAAQQAPPRPDRYVLLTVSDDGVGMSQQVLAHVFEPFFTTKEAGKGTGLGLAMVYGAVQQNGGRIEVESEVSQGTTFKLQLPQAVAALEDRLTGTAAGDR